MTDAKRVLIVDDEPGVRKMLQAVVESVGIQCDIAENGHVGFRKATREDYDLVMMDIAMPDWNGMDALRSIQMVKPDCKVIVISGFLDETMESELKNEPNVVACFRKPVEVDPLAEFISNALS